MNHSSPSLDDFELVISDNASSDRTGDICRAYASKDERLKYFCMRQNYGVFRLSTDEYFKWAASDDVCGRDYLFRAVEVLDQDPSTVLVWGRPLGSTSGTARSAGARKNRDEFGGVSLLPRPRCAVPPADDEYLVVDGPFNGLIRATALEVTRWLHPRHMSGDQILLTELSLVGRFYELPEETFFVRVHAGKTSSQQRTLRDRSRPVFQRHPGWGPIGWWPCFAVTWSDSSCTRSSSGMVRSPRARNGSVNKRWLKRPNPGHHFEFANSCPVPLRGGRSME